MKSMGSGPKISWRGHAVSAVQAVDFSKWCSNNISRGELKKSHKFNFKNFLHTVAGDSYDDDFPTDLDYHSPCSSNADCPPHLACTMSPLDEAPGQCDDPWCWREEWNCGPEARCRVVNHHPVCVKVRLLKVC